MTVLPGMQQVATRGCDDYAFALQRLPVTLFIRVITRRCQVSVTCERTRTSHVFDIFMTSEEPEQHEVPSLQTPNPFTSAAARALCAPC